MGSGRAEIVFGLSVLGGEVVPYVWRVQAGLLMQCGNVIPDMGSALLYPLADLHDRSREDPINLDCVGVVLEDWVISGLMEKVVDLLS